MNTRRRALLALVLVLLGIFLAACTPNSATTSATCGYLVGDGKGGHDSKIHKVIYPGQTVKVGDEEDLWFVPCNSRNYIINDGTQFNANNEKVGDRGQLIKATTSTGIPITIAATAYWTLNQSDQAMHDFYNVCFKYQCATSSDQSGDINFATKGWNGMLAENFGPTMDAIGRLAAIKVDDSIWKKHDPEQYIALQDAMAAAFADQIRATLGYPEDLFCGSGNSRWRDTEHPGAEGNEFDCSVVRIEVNDVQGPPNLADDSSDGARVLNELRLENAKALYGPDAGYWLGLQDSIEKCRNAGATCIINLGGGSGALAVPIPANSPVPTPTSSPE